MDAASLLAGLLLGALLATAVTLGVVTMLSRRRPDGAGLEPVHESLDHLHRLLAGIERDRATAHGELREQMGTVGQASAQLKHETAALVTALRTPHVRGRWGRSSCAASWRWPGWSSTATSSNSRAARTTRAPECGPT
ncbi:DNA recombination protein RmuC [Blastococcus brunescens]|uniref:DNA recombination protein RmuC n=1 Tax=Blastococcus brunescens TaxID=1564165 RepID=A0ABZ1B549_9ACTN|nr:DNA recombination protein RmuC [Blastococcus sp. BMG 8361]WRL64831.1 DNA recombination protein RmuC [Blastococcus sp. BMG 8361]